MMVEAWPTLREKDMEVGRAIPGRGFNVVLTVIGKPYGVFSVYVYIHRFLKILL